MSGYGKRNGKRKVGTAILDEEKAMANEAERDG